MNIKISKFTVYILIFSLITTVLTSCSKQDSKFSKLMQQGRTQKIDNTTNVEDKINSTKSDNVAIEQTQKQPVTQDQIPIVQGTKTEQKKNIKVPKVKAIYLTGWTVGNPANVQKIINLIKSTELNAVVIDIKDDDGKVGYETSIKEVRDIGAWEKKYDADKVLQAFHENNIYVIGRLVCFKDPILADKRKDLAFKTKDGGVWRDWNKRPWVNPFNRETWDYIINISKEAIDKGFDEIQYDYVRFSNDGDIRNIDFGPNFDTNTKSDIIAEFLRKSKKELQEGKGAALSADVFGIAAVGTADDKILGQNWEKLAKEVDYLCPMVYPSHYANTKQNGMGQDINGVLFKKPDLEPYNVIYQTLLSGKNRLGKVEYKTHIRPYLQAFSAPWLGEGYWQKYGAQQVKEQIKAVYDAGYEEWILWDPNNSYPEVYFEKKK